MAHAFRCPKNIQIILLLVGEIIVNFVNANHYYSLGKHDNVNATTESSNTQKEGENLSLFRFNLSQVDLCLFGIIKMI